MPTAISAVTPVSSETAIATQLAEARKTIERLSSEKDEAQRAVPLLESNVAEAKRQNEEQASRIETLQRHTKALGALASARAMLRNAVYEAVIRQQASALLKAQRTADDERKSAEEAGKSDIKELENLRSEVSNLHQRLASVEQNATKANQTIASNESIGTARIAQLQAAAQGAEARAAGLALTGQDMKKRTDALALDLEHTTALLDDEKRAAARSEEKARKSERDRLAAAEALAASRAIADVKITSLQAARDDEAASVGRITAALHASADDAAQERAKRAAAEQAKREADGKAAMRLATLLRLRAQMAVLLVAQRRASRDLAGRTDAHTIMVATAVQQPLFQENGDVAKRVTLLDVMSRAPAPLEAAATVGRHFAHRSRESAS